MSIKKTLINDMLPVKWTVVHLSLEIYANIPLKEYLFLYMHYIPSIRSLSRRYFLTNHFKLLPNL